MPIDAVEFFEKYVLAPFDAWTRDERSEGTEWKAFAVANGLNAMVEFSLFERRPDLKLRDSNGSLDKNERAKALGNFRAQLPNRSDHDHIRYVAEVFKHVEKLKMSEIPYTLDALDRQKAGPFSPEFSPDFDKVRMQIGFPFLPTGAQPGQETWVPLRRVAERCIAYWRQQLGM